MRILFIGFLAISFFSSAKVDKKFYFISEKHHVEVIDLERYTSSHEIEGVSLQNEENLVSFSIRDNCELLNLNLYILKKGKKKKVKIDKTLISSTMSYGSFFNGQKTYFLPIAAFTHFILEYSVNEQNTVFVTAIDSSGYYEANHIEYSFRLPDGLRLSVQNKELADQQDYRFTKADFSAEQDVFYLLVLPKGEIEADYFSNWMNERIQKINSLKSDNIPAHLTEMHKRGANLELAEACFKFIQKDIRYLDIENGVNAIVPRASNFVLENKYGDCKDMANALVSLLNHFGFEAYNCISRTNQKPGIFDFPTVAKANHMIAGLKFNGNWIFLDATEENCRFGDPSMQILGTETFAIGHKEGYFLKVPDSPQAKAYVDIHYKLNVEKQQIVVDLSLHGKTNTLIFDQRNDPEVFDRITAKMFSYSLPLTDHTITDTLSLLHFEGTLPRAFVTQLSTKQIVQTNFLADMESLILLSSYAYFPLYPFEIDSKIIFENTTLEKIQISDEFWTKQSDDSSFQMKQYWSSHKSKKDFDSSTEWTKYKTDSAKPILITP